MAADLDAGKLPLVAIIGPTASGKTAAALRIAAEIGGEIICADSRTVYKGLDVGTAKPTAYERALIPHHLLDVVDPSERYSAARFQYDARQAIAAIRQRGNVPLLVGGSGLYVDSILFNYDFGGPADLNVRAELEKMSLDELSRYCSENNITLPNNLYNKRYVIRAIEQKGINDLRSSTVIENTIVVGIATESERLKVRINVRSRAMIDNGLLAEAEYAAEKYGWDSEALNAPEYKVSRRLLEGSVTPEQAVDELARADWQLARKQSTWFRRNPYIMWMSLDEVEPYVRSIFVHQ